MHGSELVETKSRWDQRGLACLLLVALAFNIWGVGVGWKNVNLPGCEFRQTQTAISAMFIQRENNFSLAYPTPVLGKPWSIPMEFPLYQWSVVGVGNTTGWPLTQSGRAVSVVCFYLALPALYLLLGRLRLGRAHRLIAMAMVLLCPLHIFYARAFLIETMAMMFGVWFLAAYLMVTEGRQRALWVPVAMAAGIGCGLVKVTTLMFFLLPAFGWTLWWLYRDLRLPEGRWRSVAARSLWCLAAAIPACVVALWWVRYADAVKAASVDGQAFTSERLVGHNFGTGVRFSSDVWAYHWRIIFGEIASWPALALCGAVVVARFRRIGGLVLGLVALFFAVQLVFPVLYAWHAYYYVTNAFALMFALGIALGELLGSRLPRPLAWVVVLAVSSLQIRLYIQHHYPAQVGIDGGGSSMTTALQRVIAPDEVIIICGEDWNSMIPYYAQRRAYMIRQNMERDWDAILPALARLQGEDVTALLLSGPQTENSELIRIASERFGIDPHPAFRWEKTVVYLHRDIWHRAQPELRNYPGFKVFADGPDVADEREILTSKLLRRDQEILPSCIDPRSGETVRPFKSRSTFGRAMIEHDGRKFLMAHPVCKYWFKLGAGHHVWRTDAALLPAAYADELPAGDRSDGVEIRLEMENGPGGAAPLFSRLINPRDNLADRGIQHLTAAFDLPQDAVVVLSVLPGPHGNASRDWALIGRVAFE